MIMPFDKVIFKWFLYIYIYDDIKSCNHVIFLGSFIFIEENIPCSQNPCEIVKKFYQLIYVNEEYY